MPPESTRQITSVASWDIAVLSDRALAARYKCQFQIGELTRRSSSGQSCRIGVSSPTPGISEQASRLLSAGITAQVSHAFLEQRALGESQRRRRSSASECWKSWQAIGKPCSKGIEAIQPIIFSRLTSSCCYFCSRQFIFVSSNFIFDEIRKKVCSQGLYIWSGDKL